MSLIPLLVVILAAVGILAVSRLTHLKHKLSIISVILLVLFLYISFTGVASNNSVQINSVSDFFSVVKLYFSWLGHVFDNVRVISGNIVRMDWSPINSTG